MRLRLKELDPLCVERIKRCWVEEDITQVEIAERFNLAHTTITRICKGLARQGRTSYLPPSRGAGER